VYVHKIFEKTFWYLAWSCHAPA